MARFATLSSMWLPELKKKNASAAREQEGSLPEPLEAAEENDAITITKAEHMRWNARDQDLQESLAQAVRHIDPAEYTDDRIQQLLATAQQNGSRKTTGRRASRQADTRKEGRNAVRALPRVSRRRT